MDKPNLIKQTNQRLRDEVIELGWDDYVTIVVELRPYLTGPGD